MYGLPTSWEPNIATKMFYNSVTATWSPCSRTIAISMNFELGVKILDAVTLATLTTLEFPIDAMCFAKRLIFSPDGHLITWLGSCGSIWKFVTWDLQTGVVVSSISPEQEDDHRDSCLVTYSACGTMFGVLFCHSNDFTLCVYNALSGTRSYSHPVKGPISCNIWTCGEFLQFATMGTESVTIWELGFISTYPPTEVEMHSIPDGFHSPDVFLFHPTLPQLALMKGKGVCVWSTQGSKFLLDSTSLHGTQQMSFSPDGQFFVCDSRAFREGGLEILLWKESYTGYVLHKRLTSKLGVFKPLISPDGGSTIVFGGPVIQLWHTMDSTTPLPISSQNPNHFIVEFSPDQVLAAVVKLEDEIVTVLDVKSGIPQLIIHAGMGVYGLGITRSSIVVVGDGKIVTWNLPIGDHVSNLRMDITNSIQTTTFNHRQFNNDRGMPAAFISPDLHYIAIKDICIGEDGQSTKESYSLYLYDIPTGQYCESVPVKQFAAPWFTLDGYEVRCWEDYHMDRWKIIQGSESNISKLEYLESARCHPNEVPWKPSHGYRLVDDQWIFDSSGKRLFWLPPHWRVCRQALYSRTLWEWRILEWHSRNRTWRGQFLMLLHDELSEAVILELK